ncbi:MAG: LuxR family transcriptional regulator [Silicimonas sp.]|nr:LuxR family transcriptional regulator [Silicimonas sp.]
MTTHGTTASITDALQTLVTTLTVEDAWDVHCRTMRAYGFDRMVYGLTRFHMNNEPGHKNDFLLLSSMPDGYIETFIRDGLYKSGPMTRWAQENVGAMSWSWIAENEAQLSDEERKVVAFNREYDVTVGYTLSFQDSNTRHRSGLGLVAETGIPQHAIDDLWQVKGSEISALCHVAHLKFSSLPWPKSHSGLSRRQREVLEWVGDGKTMQDIATILGLTQATVEKHLKNARQVLGVDTTAQALRKASVQNQIFVIEQ